MKKETLLEVVSELVGYTEPYGDSHIDETRYENQEKNNWISYKWDWRLNQ